MDSKFRFLLGELYHYGNNIANGKPFYYHLTKMSDQLKGKDMKLVFEGSVPCIEVISPLAHREFSNLQPKFIDRVPDYKGVGKLAPT